jgi:hypothetical protein
LVITAPKSNFEVILEKKALHSEIRKAKDAEKKLKELE